MALVALFESKCLKEGLLVQKVSKLYAVANTYIISILQMALILVSPGKAVMLNESTMFHQSLGDEKNLDYGKVHFSNLKKMDPLITALILSIVQGTLAVPLVPVQSTITVTLNSQVPQQSAAINARGPYELTQYATAAAPTPVAGGGDTEYSGDQAGGPETLTQYATAAAPTPSPWWPIDRRENPADAQGPLSARGPYSLTEQESAAAPTPAPWNPGTPAVPAGNPYVTARAENPADAQGPLSARGPYSLTEQESAAAPTPSPWNPGTPAVPEVPTVVPPPAPPVAPPPPPPPPAPPAITARAEKPAWYQPPDDPATACNPQATQTMGEIKCARGEEYSTPLPPNAPLTMENRAPTEHISEEPTAAPTIVPAESPAYTAVAPPPPPPPPVEPGLLNPPVITPARRAEMPQFSSIVTAPSSPVVRSGMVTAVSPSFVTRPPPVSSGAWLA
ncbi:MAG: hypothetical protein Q9227_007332 [Pyrenula ochraceoflavens]